MFVTRKRYEIESRYAESQHDELKNLYWSLARRHERLLDKLGLYEQVISKTVLREKGGPERGDE